MATSSSGAARVAVCSSEAYTTMPAGPALRAAGLTRGLAAHGVDTVLVAPVGSQAPAGVDVALLEDLPAIVASGATVVASGFLLERYPVLAEARHLVVDAAGPFLLENLVIHQQEPAERRRRIATDEAAVLARLLAAADLVLVANERQRDLTFGFMLASGAILPELIDEDPALDRFFLTVPFGPTGSLKPVEHPPGHGLHLVWPGGLWDWLDPRTLVDAIAIARAQGTRVTAELWGARSPDPLVPPPRSAVAVQRHAADRDVLDAVEIVDWVPYAERAERLARADAAVTLDRAGIEARYAFRTRLVDALAAGVPVIATAGEVVADRAAASGAGFTVPPGDAAALAALFKRWRSDRAPLERARQRAAAIGQEWAYETTTADLAAWCRDPRTSRAGGPALAGPAAAGGAIASARRLAGMAQRALGSSTRSE